jgi:hypothetical protein
MRIFFLFLFWIPLLWGSITQPLSLEMGVGYSYDRINEKAFTNTSAESLVYEEKYLHHAMQTLFTLRTIQRDFFVLASAGYGYLGNRDMKERWGDQKLAFSPNIHFKTKGHSWQSIGLLGYAVNVIPDHFHQCLLIPHVGYGGFWTNIQRHSPHPSPDIWQNSTIYPGIKEKRTKDLWYGPSLGLLLEGDPWQDVWVRIGYSFYFLDIHHQTFSSLQEKRYIGDSVGVDHILSLKEKLASGRGSGHVGEIQCIYSLNSHWKVSILSILHYFYASKKRLLHKTLWEETLLPDQNSFVEKGKDKFTGRWYTLSFLGELIYAF